MLSEHLCVCASLRTLCPHSYIIIRRWNRCVIPKAYDTGSSVDTASHYQVSQRAQVTAGWNSIEGWRCDMIMIYRTWTVLWSLLGLSDGEIADELRVGFSACSCCSGYGGTLPDVWMGLLFPTQLCSCVEMWWLRGVSRARSQLISSHEPWG